MCVVGQTEFTKLKQLVKHIDESAFVILIEANINNDKDIVAEVEGYVKDLRDAWKQALQIERQGRFGSGGLA